MGTKRSSNQLKAYLPVNLTDAASAFLRLCISLLVLVSVACTKTTINETTPPVSQANPNTRVSDPDDWTGGGTGDGGGGQGVLCSSEAKDANAEETLLVRDIYEAKYNYARTLDFAKLGPAGTEKVDDASIEMLVKNLRKAYRVSAWGREFVSLKFWKDFSSQITFVPDSNSLYASKDANSPLKLPTGCKVVQIAYWDESSGVNSQGTLYVDKARWVKLDQFNKIALLAHEYFFRQARLAGYTNSDYARFKVGQLLSEEGLPTAFSKWESSEDLKVSDWLPKRKKGFKVCEGLTNNVTDVFSLVQFEESFNHQILVIPFISVLGNVMPPLRMQGWAYDTDGAEALDVNVVTDSFYSPSVNPEEKISEVTPKEIGLDKQPYAVVASIQFPAKDKMGVISILNNLNEKHYEDLEMKPREQLIYYFQQFLEIILAKVIGDHPEAGKIQLDLISSLNKDVDAQIKLGTFRKFSSWQGGLMALEDIQGQKIAPAYRNVLYKGAPYFLYRLKIGSYNKLDVYRATGMNGFVQSSKATDAHINVSIGGKSESFRLSCKSWDDMYADITRRSGRGN